MTLTERINKERRQPDEKIVPLVERRRATPRWIEWTREHQQESGKDMSGYLREVA